MCRRSGRRPTEPLVNEMHMQRAARFALAGVIGVAAAVVGGLAAAGAEGAATSPPERHATTPAFRSDVAPFVDVATLKRAVVGDNGAVVYLGGGIRAGAPDCMVAVDAEGTSVGCVGAHYDYKARPRVIQGVLRPSRDIEVIVKAAPGFTTAQAGKRHAPLRERGLRDHRPDGNQANRAAERAGRDTGDRRHVERAAGLSLIDQRAASAE